MRNYPTLHLETNQSKGTVLLILFYIKDLIFNFISIPEETSLVRTDMAVNEHKRLYNDAFRHTFK